MIADGGDIAKYLWRVQLFEYPPMEVLRILKK